MFGPSKAELTEAVNQLAKNGLKSAENSAEIADQIRQLIGISETLAKRVTQQDEKILKLSDALDRLHAEVLVTIREELDARTSEAKS